jgi:hypothetical protein
MKKSIYFLIGLSLICCSQLMAQNYIASDFWKMEQDSVYNSLKKRQSNGDSLSVGEKDYFIKYKAKLDNYFEKMSDSEKSWYYQNRAMWERQPGAMNKLKVPQEPDIYLGEKSTYSRYIAWSGVFGFAYGLAAVGILDINEGGAIAIPLLTAGASTLIPLLTTKDQKVTYNSLKLSIHGKTAGAIHGAALSMLLQGDNVGDNYKVMLGLSTLSSIGLGRLGYVLGRDKPWSPGRAGLYTCYGILMPLEGATIAGALGVEDVRVVGLAILAGGAGGYLIADRVAQKYDFTPGDITATKSLIVTNTLLGIGIMSDVLSNSEGSGTGILLVPAATALGGTLLSHYWLRDAHLTSQQGRNTALATFGGAAMGLGVAALFQSESATPYYLIPYITGLSSFALIVHKYKQNNQVQFFKTEKDNKWNLNIMPQNILLNQKFAGKFTSFSGRQPNFLPAFSASCNF